MADGLPADWQSRMVDMIRGAVPVDPGWFTGGPVCTPTDQIEIYVRQYRLRLMDALLVEVPGLKALLPDVEAREALLRRYLHENPSRSWTLNRVADRLPEWLNLEPEVPKHLVEMAHLDRAVQRGFEAADGEDLDPTTLAGMPRLRLQPHVSLLRVGHNVHALRAAALGGQPLPEVTAGDYPLVVFRRGIKMRHWVLPLPAWGILDGIGWGLSVPEAIEAVFARGWIDAEVLSAEIGGWFKDFAERRLVERCSASGD